MAELRTRSDLTEMLAIGLCLEEAGSCEAVLGTCKYLLRIVIPRRLCTFGMQVTEVAVDSGFQNTGCSPVFIRILEWEPKEESPLLL